MRIAIIGPTHPYKGGIVQQTTELAHRLTAVGHDVEIIGWRTQYPFFYPGKQFVDKPELPLHPGARRVLSWRNPAGWARWGRRLRSFDRLIFVWWVPTIQGPVYLGMLRALGRKRPPVTLICHNVLPHEPRRGDKQLARSILKRSDKVIVHSHAQADIAAGLSGKPATILSLPITPLPGVKKAIKKTLDKELLFFGFVRPYKGLDVLLKALAQVPEVKLTIAGEIWGDPKIYTELIEELGLEERVSWRSEYLPDEDLDKLIVRADAGVLPYKSGTASLNVTRANIYGTPVIAAKVGSLGTQVRHDVDGLLCEPGDVASLVAAINHFYEPGVAQRLQKAIPKISPDEDWQRYVTGVTTD